MPCDPISDPIAAAKHEPTVQFLAQINVESNPGYNVYMQSLQPPSAYTGTQYGSGAPDALAAQQHVLERLYQGPSDERIKRSQISPEAVFCQQMCSKYFSPKVEAYSVEYSTWELEYWNSIHVPQSTARVAALNRLKAVDKEKVCPDIIFKAYEDLDLVFFLGRLKYLSCLRWETSEQMGVTINKRGRFPWGVSRIEWRKVQEPVTKIWRFFPVQCIILNSTMHFLCASKRSQWDEMWGSLLHEMVHGYLYASTPFGQPLHWPTDEDPSHGVHFQRCLAAVNAMCSWYGLGMEGIYEGKWTIHETEEEKKARGLYEWEKVLEIQRQMSGW